MASSDLDEFWGIPHQVYSLKDRSTDQELDPYNLTEDFLLYMRSCGSAHSARP